MTLRLIPNRDIDNKNLVSLAQAIAAFYEPPMSRWNGRGFDPLPVAAWEIYLSPGKIAFCLTIPQSWEPVIKKEVSRVWPDVTIKKVVDPLPKLRPNVAAKLELKEHYVFSLKVDRRNNAPLESLLESLGLMEKGDLTVVQVLLQPAPPDWWESAADAYEGFRQGEMPRRLRPQKIGHHAMRFAAGVVFEVVETLHEIAEVEWEGVDLDGGGKAKVLRDGPMGSASPQKIKGDALETTIRVAVKAPRERAEAILRSAGMAFRDLDGDNALVMKSVDAGRALSAMAHRRTGVKIDKDLLSVSEASQLLRLPTAALQKRYNIKSIDTRQVQLPKAVTSGGLHLGSSTFHGKNIPVYIPTGNLDELCLPRLVVGGMGCGKTKGFGANLAVEAVRSGYSAIIIDPAKGEMGDEIESALPPEKIIRVRFGHDLVCLDWREALHSERTRSRLASELISYCDLATDEAGAQTIRFMRAAAKAVPNGKLSEVIRLFTDGQYRKQLIPTMRDQEKITWEQFDSLSDARQTQISMPVLNRLDVITGDDYLLECLETDQGLDFVDLMEQRKAVIIDVPKAELGGEAIDVLAGLIATKLDLAMVLRKAQHPVFVIMDEPHQYTRGARIWRSAAVESRKWRVAYTWLFHSYEQIPRDVFHIIQAAGPHYHLYSSSRATYQALTEELKPFTVDEALRTKRFHAINILRAQGKLLPAFMAKMSKPPSLV